MSKVMTRTVTVGLEDGTIEEFQIDASEPEDRLPKVLEGALRARQRAKTPGPVSLPTNPVLSFLPAPDSGPTFDLDQFLEQYR